jgi:hypothetical protein
MRNLLFVCALALLTNSPSRAQQPQTKPDRKSAALDPADKPKRKVLDADLSGFDISDPKSDKKITTMLGGSRTAAIPSSTLLAPKHAKLLGAGALFSWSFSGHNEGYVFILTDEDETQIVREQVTEPHYRASGIFDKLGLGTTYYWRVQVLPNPLASEPFEFTVVSNDERNVIDKAIIAIPHDTPYQQALARARILVDHRLWFDALGAYDDLIAKFPDHSELYDQRGAIYAQIPATKLLADADFARADKSTR